MNKLSKTNIVPKIDQKWKAFLSDEFNSENFRELHKFLMNELAEYTIYPAQELFFEAFNRTPLAKLKVVIIGQDPYHGKDQAHGLSFSVPNGIKIPPSLKNIFTELENDLSIDLPDSGNLERWAEQGVLLLNATLSVRASSPGSHQGKGWEFFTDAVISKISQECDNLVFILWGKFAQAKSCLIDVERHLILECAHPSPFSASKGFFGCQHFSKTNDFLISKRLDPINWNLNE